MASTARALARLARAFPDVALVLPAHLNPAVREVLLPPLVGLENVIVTDPLAYGDFAKAMATCTLVLTDSGGVQEEAPSLGKPVLVLRETTERPEAVAAGTVRLVGTDEDVIVTEVSRLLSNPVEYDAMARSVNPYGDGLASGRVVQAIENYFGLGPKPNDFRPAASTATSRSTARSAPNEQRNHVGSSRWEQPISRGLRDGLNSARREVTDCLWPRTTQEASLATVKPKYAHEAMESWRRAYNRTLLTICIEWILGVLPDSPPIWVTTASGS